MYLHAWPGVQYGLRKKSVAILDMSEAKRRKLWNDMLKANIQMRKMLQIYLKEAFVGVSGRP